ncbi:MAG: hypothetical protein HKP58_14400 [Desulfatitalea sp.]|nr:hypothetical protein [Desulfatitalea sp.]NNK01596.1 hypothetical protein [Desulfatitalea sp.]
MGDSEGNATKSGPEGFRMPLIKSPADVEALSHLSPDEKALGVENLKKFPPSDGYFIMGNDPDMQATLRIMEMEITSLLHPDHQGIPFSPMNLMALEVARHIGNDYLTGLMQNVTANTIGDFQKPYDHYMKLGMIENQDSAVWNDEQQLAIKFTRACLEFNMTDEVFEQARAAWGEKKVLRYIAWISYVHQWGMIQSALGMKYLPETMTYPRGSMTPEVIDVVISKLKDTKEKVRKFWIEET